MFKKLALRVALLLLVTIMLFTSLCSCQYFDALSPDKDSGRSNDSSNDNKEDIIVDGDLEIHFLELGNQYTGDCTYIKAGEKDILIDAGSKVSSIETIDNYLSDHVTDDKLEYVIVTHAHEDHYAGFATHESTQSLFDLYKCEVIIDFAQITSDKSEQIMYNNYIRERNAEIQNGATHYTAAECIQNENINGKFDLGDGITLTVLDSYYYYNRSGEENNHSVCVMIDDGKNHYLFTGDLEKEGEEKLVEMNDLPEVKLYKAGHHGSKTSSNDVLLSVIKPEIICVCCCCGSPQYTEVNSNQFPTQAFIDRIAPYTDKVYVTTLCIDYEKKKFESMNGNIVVYSVDGVVNVKCSASDEILKNSEWFKENRGMPDAWK
jgi:competence protein ComEC